MSLRTLLILILLFHQWILIGQPIKKRDTGGGNPLTTLGEEPPLPPNRVPISGLEWLMGGALLYGVRKLRQKDKNSQGS